MEKLYETCAKNVMLIIHQHREETKKVGQAVEKINSDKRYTPEGKQEFIQKLRQELKELNEKGTDEIKKEVNKFCQRYQIIHIDEKADSQEVANALKVIEMAGYKLTSELLRSVLEPLKESYSALKMIKELLDAKQSNAIVAETTFDSDVMMLMEEYLGGNAEIYKYEEAFNAVKEVLDAHHVVNAGIYGEPVYGSGTVNVLRDDTSYMTLCLCDNMMKVGKMYESLYLKYPNVFK